MVVPSDHEITTEADFWATVERGVPAALAGNVVVFGIAPTGPETGFGYIEAGEAAAGGQNLTCAGLWKSRTWKRPKQYVAAGNFFWNAGIFLFRASTMQAAFEKHAPDIWKGVTQALALSQADEPGTHIRQRLSRNPALFRLTMPSSKSWTTSRW